MKTKMRTLILLPAFMLLSLFAGAQTKYFTRNGRAYFNASSPLEKIDAVNNKASSIIDLSTGQVEFAILMKAFLFERALMQEHFNENYVESDKFPKASFKGTVSDIASVNLAKDGTYKLKVNGQLTLHGVTKEIETIADFTVRNGTLSASSDFTIECADYDIQIPGLVKDKVAKTVNINILANYELYKAF